MEPSRYVVGRAVQDGTPVGEAHAVLVEAVSGSEPVTAECGVRVQPTESGWPPASQADGGPCPVCARTTGAAV